MEHVVKKGENAQEVKYNKWAILFCVVTMTFMSCIDGSIVNVALPKISYDLNKPILDTQWIVTTYLMVISTLVLLCGRIGDIKGKCKVFKVGVLIFTIGSFFSGLSKTLPLLIVSRAIQGVGGSCAMAATGMGIITAFFNEKERGKAMGLSASAVAMGVMVGPALGGILVSIRWDLIFWINVPIGIIAFLLSMVYLPKMETNSKEKIDIRGTIVFAIFIVSSMLSITKGEVLGYTDKYIMLGFIVSIVSFTVFIYLQKTVESPVLDLNLFKTKLFSISIVCSALSFLAISSMNIIIPLYLEQALQMSSLHAGLFLMIYPLCLSIVAPLSGSLSDRFNGRLISLIGISLLTVALFFMGRININSTLIYLGTCCAIMGVGNGIFKSTNNALVMEKVPKHRLGIAGSVNSLVSNLAMAYGFTFATTILYGRMSYRLGYKVTNYIPGHEEAFLYGLDCVFFSATIMCLIASVVAFIRYRRKDI
ncbi:MFS transporter [Clostridium perfringens]|uniref:MFS transporter n=1 Tax=Clostridium perfringens TaxID=1502 RepID=UPI001B8164DE|nr:MFS transporter [Clostridium perfringens]HBC2034106.1 MFS transporter [Clostridium perfringens]HBC2057174.1 MFS transporter [Clostridium perfringens]HBC2071294.1 MFS transporter [Clostridium perfringens]